MFNCTFWLRHENHEKIIFKKSIMDILNDVYMYLRWFIIDLQLISSDFENFHFWWFSSCHWRRVLRIPPLSFKGGSQIAWGLVHSTIRCEALSSGFSVCDLRVCIIWGEYGAKCSRLASAFATWEIESSGANIGKSRSSTSEYFLSIWSIFSSS